MYPNELTFAITALANAIAAGLSERDLCLLSAIIRQLGETLSTLAVAKKERTLRNDTAFPTNG